MEGNPTPHKGASQTELFSKMLAPLIVPFGVAEPYLGKPREDDHFAKKECLNISINDRNLWNG